MRVKCHMDQLNITVVGLGYVGLSNAMMLSKNHTVIAYDIDLNRINQLAKKQSPIKDKLIQKFLLETTDTNFLVTSNRQTAFSNCDMVIIATPTSYNELNNSFDTSSIEITLKFLQEINSKSLIVIKSTVPIGFTKTIKRKFANLEMVFSPEFLREGQALYDNLYPSRIIVGDKGAKGKMVANVFKKSALKKDVEILLTNSTEAEAIKLFSNTYLAMRVAYFNELDNYCFINDLNTGDVIAGVSLDPRIGNYYNNPSFGYGGYCLPKDSKQLLANYNCIPQKLISAIVDSNESRKIFIANQILLKKPRIVGIYYLTMKAGSDNFREAAILDIINLLIANDVEIIIYEPSLGSLDMKINLDISREKIKIMDSLNRFKKVVDLIIANRVDSGISDVMEKVFTRDIFNEN